MYRFVPLALLAMLAGCNNQIYVIDGVTDGDTFYLAERALTDDDPVLQSWVTYSLAKSACQLEIGGENPARASSFRCEHTARLLLLDTWKEKRAADPAIADDYLDTLLNVRGEGFLGAYVVHYFGRAGWQVPDEVDAGQFRAWRRRHLRGHRPETRIIGSWNYRQR